MKLNFIKQENIYAYAEHYRMKLYQTAHLNYPEQLQTTMTQI